MFKAEVDYIGHKGGTVLHNSITYKMTYVYCHFGSTS